MSQQRNNQLTAQPPVQSITSPSRSKQQQHLDALQSMINAILIETGKALRSANKKGVKTIAQDNERLQAMIPSAVDKFHLALDELECDIVKAKAVIGRDLRELRARKFALDHPVVEPIQETFLPIDIGDTMSASLGQPAQVIEATEVPLLNKKEEQPFHQQGLSADGLSVPKTESHSNLSSPHAALNDIPLKPENPADSLDFLFDESSAPVQVQETENKSAIPGEESQAPNADASNPTTEAPATEDPDMNYESLFGDADHADAADLSFDDFDFGTGDTSNQNQEYTHTEGEIDLSTFGQPPSYNDGTSMLQGLETYANAASDDVGMLDGQNPDLNSNHLANSGQDAAHNNESYDMSGGDVDMNTNMEDTTFDDLMNEIDFGDDNGDGGAGGDLIDSSGFDDAFFGMTDS